MRTAADFTRERSERTAKPSKPKKPKPMPERVTYTTPDIKEGY